MILDLARRTKGRRVSPFKSLKVSQVSCCSRQLATLHCAYTGSVGG